MSDLSLDGLSSGLPTNDMIEQLMQIERQPIYRYEENKVELKEQKDAWRDVNSRIDNLANTLSDLKLSSTYNSMKATSSNQDIVTASATSDAGEGSYDIKVIDTAQIQRLSGNKLDSSTTSFSELFDSFPASSNIMVNGSSIEITETDTLESVVDKVNNNASGVNASIVDNHLVLESSETGIEKQLGIIDDNDVLEKLGVLSQNADDTILQSAPVEVTDADTGLGYVGQFKVNIENTAETATVDVTSDTSLNAIANDINSQLSNDPASVIDNGDGTYTLKLNDPANPIKMENTSADGEDNIIEALRIGNQDLNNELQKASDAEIEVNGITGITSSDNTFSDVVEGVTFYIDETSQNGDTATVTVNQDTEKAASNVQDFVDQYNSVMDFIKNKLDYDSETEKAGTLQGDSTLMRLEMRIRSLVTDRVDTQADYNHLGTVGIDIDEEGVMSFDSSKLKEALENSPEEVMNLFKAEEEDDGFNGVATRLNNYLDQLIQTNTGVIPKRIDYYDNQMDRIDEDIESLKRRLETTRERYVEQFTAMETAISEMNQQQSWMQSQLSSLGSAGNLISSMT